MKNVTSAPFTEQVARLDSRSDLEAKKCFEEKRALSAWQAMRLMAGTFWKVYHAEKARGEGARGLFHAVNEGMFHFLTYAKCWELERNARKNG